jgi:hypothetical protein
MQSNSLFTIAGITMVACSILPSTFGCHRNTDPAQSASANIQPTVNIYGARKLDSVVVRAEIERAWNNYLDSLGTEAPDKPLGLSDAEIEFIESETRQRLPEDVKAFLRLCPNDGSFFNDGFRVFDADEIVDWWKFLVDLNYVHTSNDPSFHAIPVKASPTWFGPVMIPLMSEDVYEIHVDIRTGKVIEALDGPCGVLADSLVEMLDELARHNRAGRRVVRFSIEGKKVGPFLNSQMWHVYE